MVPSYRTLQAGLHIFLLPRGLIGPRTQRDTKQEVSGNSGTIDKKSILSSPYLRCSFTVTHSFIQ